MDLQAWHESSLAGNHSTHAALHIGGLGRRSAGRHESQLLRASETLRRLSVSGTTVCSHLMPTSLLLRGGLLGSLSELLLLSSPGRPRQGRQCCVLRDSCSLGM